VSVCVLRVCCVCVRVGCVTGYVLRVCCVWVECVLRVCSVCDKSCASAGNLNQSICDSVCSVQFTAGSVIVKYGHGFCKPSLYVI